MKIASKIIVAILAGLLSVLAALVLWNRYPDGGSGDTITHRSGGLRVIWEVVGFHCFLATFCWAKLFLKFLKSLVIAIAVWIAVGIFYTIIEVSIQHNIKTPVSLLESSESWEPVHADTFMDGGSVALGLLNDSGEIMYIWAYRTATLSTNEPQAISLVMNYNDPHDVKILPGSNLEKQMVNILDNLTIRPEQKVYLPLVDDFTAVLLDRKNHVYEEYWKKESNPRVDLAR